MTHWPRSLRDVRYRLFLLRRLTLVCATMIWAGLALSGLIHGADETWFDHNAVTWVAALALIGPAAFNVLFPGAWIEALAMALTAAVGVLLWPLLQANSGVQSAVGLVLLLPLAALTLTCIFTWLISKAHGVWPMGELRTESEIVLPAPADKVMDWQFPRARQNRGRRISGPADEKGVFPVSFGFLFPDPETWTISLEEGGPDTPDAYVRVVERGDFHQVSHYMMCKTGTTEAAGTSLIAREEVTPIDETSCRYRCEEVHDLWDFVTWASSWLVDQSRDFRVELADDLRGVETVAVRGLPQVTPLSMLAKLLTRLGLAGSGSGRKTG